MLLKYGTLFFPQILSFEYTWELERSDLNRVDQQNVVESMKLCGFTLSKSMAQSDKNWQEKNSTYYLPLETNAFKTAVKYYYFC